jgi:hypothetical protein
MDELNIVYDNSSISITKQKPELIAEELEKVLSEEKRPSAIFAATDMIALTLIDCLTKTEVKNT